MERKSFILIIIGFLFICIDLGALNDYFNDGIGYGLIALGVSLSTKKNVQFYLILLFALLIAPLTLAVSVWASLGPPSWSLIIARCIPPVASLPMGILLVYYCQPFTGIDDKHRKKLCTYFILAQLFDLAAIVYFSPVRTSVMIDNFNTRGQVIVIAPILYFCMMLLYLSLFRLPKTGER